MVCICEYDPVRDIQKVEQNGFVDLAAANASSSIPANLAVEDLSFNEIDDPNSIVGRPSDQFDAMQLGKAVEARAKSVSKSVDGAYNKSTDGDYNK